VYSGCSRIRIKTFKGIDEPLVYRKSRTLKPPEKLPKKKERRPPEKRDNSICVAMLGYYIDLESAILDFPILDDIISGVARLDYNGERGLVKSTLFYLLASLPEITSRSVQEAMWCSDRHARNYASALRICSSTFERAYGKILVNIDTYPEMEGVAAAA